VLARAGKIDDAKAAYTKSAELDPPNAEPRGATLESVCTTRTGSATPSKPLQKSADLDPKNAQTWYLLEASLVYKMTHEKK